MARHRYSNPFNSGCAHRQPLSTGNPTDPPGKAPPPPMSTQTSFDLPGLSRAIQSQDHRYQLALYADNAELEILDRGHLDAPLQVLHGKAEIAKWLDAMSTTAVRYQVRDPLRGPDVVGFTEECIYPDGKTLVFECTAEVSRGQIKHATLTIVPPGHQAADSTTPEGETSEGGAPGGATRNDVTSAGSRRLRPTTSRTASWSSMPGPTTRTRSVAGNFLG
jgi:hypothetical protein